jgi:hypothetical protein
MSRTVSPSGLLGSVLRARPSVLHPTSRNSLSSYEDSRLLSNECTYMCPFLMVDQLLHHTFLHTFHFPLSTYTLFSFLSFPISRFVFLTLSRMLHTNHPSPAPSARRRPLPSSPLALISTSVATEHSPDFSVESGTTRPPRPRSRRFPGRRRCGRPFGAESGVPPSVGVDAPGFVRPVDKARKCCWYGRWRVERRSRGRHERPHREHVLRGPGTALHLRLNV